MKKFYIYSIIIFVSILIVYISMKLVNSYKNSTKNKSILKETTSEQLNLDKFQHNLKENIANITTIPLTSRYYYMNSDNLLKDGLNYAWFPTKTEDNKYFINVEFKKQVILKTLKIYTGLSDNNNKFTKLIIRDEVGDIIYNNENVNILPYKINNFFEVSINDIFTKKISLEFTSLEDFIVRKVIILGSVKMKSRLEKLVGKNIVPYTNLMNSNGEPENFLINGIYTSWKGDNEYDAQMNHYLIRQRYDDQTRKVTFKYKFDKIYSFYGLEITQLISGFNNYGYKKLKVYSDNLEGGEEYDSTYMTKLFKDDTNSTNDLELKSFDNPEYYTYVVYFDPLTDGNLILEFSDVVIDEFKLSRLKFYGYDVVFGYYDTVIITNYTQERLSLAELQLIDYNNNNILPSLVSENKVTIIQSPDESNSLVSLIKIEQIDKYTGEIYNLTDRNSLDAYISGNAGQYALDIGRINIRDEKGLIDKSKFDVYVTSIFKVKNQDNSIKEYSLVIQDPTNPNARYISNNQDKNPVINILFKKPTKIDMVSIVTNSMRTLNNYKVTWYNNKYKAIANFERYDIQYQGNPFYFSKNNFDVQYIYDNDINTYNQTFPNFSTWKEQNPDKNVKGPTIFMSLTEPVILKAIKIINKKENNIPSELIKGLNIAAYLSAKWSKPNSAETPFKCSEEREATKYSEGGQVLEWKTFYNAYKLNKDGNSECLSKEGEYCDSFPTLDKCNNQLRFIDKNYKNKECGIGTKENPGTDCKYYQKKYMILRDCINGNNGYNKVGYKIGFDNKELLFCEKDDNNNCKSYYNYSTCLNEDFNQTKPLCLEPSESDSVDSVCSKAKFQLLSNKYNAIYKVFDVSDSVAKEKYYFPLGIPITDQSLIMEKDNDVLCLDEYNSSNDNKNDVKFMNCTNEYSQVVRIKNYRSNSDDNIGLNKIYNSILDKCLTYINDDKLVFRNCDNDLDTIQEFNFTDEGKIKHSSGKCLNIDNFDNKNAILTSCNEASKFKISNFFSNECTSFNCSDIITHYAEYTEFDPVTIKRKIVNAYLFSLMVDADGNLILISRDFFSKKVISSINLLKEFPSKFNIMKNELFSYPYHMKILNNGALCCYDKNDKIVWRTKIKENIFYVLTTPYKLNFINIYNNENKTVSVELSIISNNGIVIETLNN